MRNIQKWVAKIERRTIPCVLTNRSRLKPIFRPKLRRIPALPMLRNPASDRNFCLTNRQKLGVAFIFSSGYKSDVRSRYLSVLGEKSHANAHVFLVLERNIVVIFACLLIVLVCLVSWGEFVIIRYW